jgi:hypothetical protein
MLTVRYPPAFAVGVCGAIRTCLDLTSLSPARGYDTGEYRGTGGWHLSLLRCGRW